MMYKLKNRELERERGITLIALVITIVLNVLVPRNGTNVEKATNILKISKTSSIIDYVIKNYKNIIQEVFWYEQSRTNAKDEGRYGDARIFNTHKR